MQAPLAAVGSLSAFISWWSDRSFAWLIGGVLLLLIIPFTVVVILPTNKRLVALFRVVEPLGAFSYPYDVSHDGTRILALTPGEGASNAAHLTVLMNWQAGLKK